MPDDYEELARRGIDVKGKIVIARYGGGWRGIKPKLADEHGAIGCLIYSDPRDDGYFAGRRLSEGRRSAPAQGVQRGSVPDMPVYSGRSADAGRRRDRGRQAADARARRRRSPKIPVLPISYGDAQPLLAALGGPVAPADWRGALPITYHLGPGPAKRASRASQFELEHEADLRRHREARRRRARPTSGSCAATITTAG